MELTLIICTVNLVGKEWIGVIYITDTDGQKIYIIINMELEIKIGYVQTEEDAIKMCEKLS